MRVFFIFVVMAFCSFASSAQPNKVGGKELVKQLGSKDAAVVEGAVAEVSRRIAEGASKEDVGRWLGAMEKGKRWETIERVAMDGMLTRPAASATVSELARYRARALMRQAEGLSGPEERATAVEVALGSAATAYRVASGDRTAEAIELVGQGLTMRGAEGERLAKRWRLEQLSGAAEGETPVLHTLPADPTAGAFAGGVRMVVGESYLDRIARVNLLLLAGDVAAAGEAARGAYEVAPEDRLSEATAALGRIMRARDGSVAGENRWLAGLGE